MAHQKNAAGCGGYDSAEEEKCDTARDDDQSTMFAMEDLGDEGEARNLHVTEERTCDKEDGEETRCEKDDVFTSSANSTSSARQARPGEVVGVKSATWASTAPLPILGPGAYHLHAQRAWLSLSAPPIASVFYLGQSPPDGGQSQRYEPEDDDEEEQRSGGGTEATAAAVSIDAAGHGDGPYTVREEENFGRAAALPTRIGQRQPLPDLVPRSTHSAADAFRRRTHSESSMSTVTVRQFASVLRRISDDFEEEVRSQQTVVVGSSSRHVVVALRSKSGSDDSDPSIVAVADLASDRAPKRRSTSFLQDLKDYLRKGNPPSSL